MLKKRYHRILRNSSALLCACILIISSTLAYAAPSSSELEEKTSELQDDIDTISNKLDTLGAELEDTSAKIKEKAKEIEMAQLDLAAAKINEENHYNAMKERIKFMYERGDTAYLELFFQAESFADFLNKSEYVEKMTQYDREMLESYVRLQEKISKDERDLEDEMTALGVLRDDALAKQEEVSGLVQETSTNMVSYAEQISEKEKELLEYERQLEESENDIATLQAKLEEENKLTQQAALAGFSDLSSINFAAGDIDLLAAIIECEAGGESYTGKVAVGNVVMNRVKSTVFPNTVLEVIYQNKQFSPVGSGRFAIVLARGANAECYQAAQDAMAGAAPVGNCLFFRTPIPGLTGMQIGGHIFY